MAESNEPTYEELLQRVEYLESTLRSNNFNNRWLKQALHSAQIGSYEWNPNTHEFIFDEWLYEVWGIQWGTPLNLEIILKGIHPDDREPVEKFADKQLKKGAATSFCTRCRVMGIENGAMRRIELSGHVIYDNQKLTRIIGIAIDISERTNKDVLLKKWESIFQNSNRATVIEDVDSKKPDWFNPKFAALHGYSVKELPGNPFDLVIAPEDHKGFTVHMGIAHKEGVHVWESAHIRKDGSKFPVNIEVTTVKNELGKISYKIIEVTDISEHKQIEQAIKESENHYKHLFQNLTSNFATHEIILDKNGNPVDYKFLEVNSAMEKATGLKASEMIGKTASELFPETEQYWIDKFGQVALTGIPSVYENYSKELNRYFELKLYSPQEGEFAMLATDTTDRKLAEQKLKESKEHFELLFELNPDAVTIIRVSDSHLINVNTGFTNLMGYTREEVIGRTTLDLHLWAYLTEREAVLKELGMHGSCINFEATFRRKNGAPIVGMVSAKIIEIHGVNHILAVTRDISLRKEFELALKESEKNLRKSQEIASLGSYRLNFKTGYWESSEILDTIFGIPAHYHKTIEGWTKLVHPEWKEAMAQYLQQEVIEKKQKFDKEYKIIRPSDQKEIWVHGLGELVFDENHTLLYMAGTVIDITDRKQAELIIQEQNTALQGLNATKDMLFSIIAHDLRGPLSSLVSSTEIMSEQLQNEDINEVKRWCAISHKLSTQTFELLNNLLEWFRAQTGLMKPKMNRHDLKPIVDEVVALFIEAASQKDIQIHNKVKDNLFLYLDKNITKTILRNLTNNAIKFTRHSGAVSIDCHIGKEHFEVIVSDTGVGIPKEIMPHLFCIGKNKPAMGTSKETGSGLGLSICKDLAEAQGGIIWAKSEINIGSSFHFTIPVHSQ